MIFYIDVFMDFYNHIINNKHLPDPMLKADLIQLIAQQEPKIQYILCSLADDILLREKDEVFWSANLLEEHFFKTHIAGERIFQLIDQALESCKYDVLGTYLYLLSLGFVGKYKNQQVKIQKYKEEIYKACYGKYPSKDYLMCPELLTNRPVEKLHLYNAYGFWFKTLGYVMAFYAVFIHISWLYYTRGLLI